MRIWPMLWPLLVLSACTPVYDAQYDDRASELERFRSVFQPGDAQVTFMTTSDSRLYWVNVDQRTSKPILHSYTPASALQLDYTIPVSTSSASDLQRSFKFSDQLIANCNFSRTLVFDATQPSGGTMLTVSGNNVNEQCTVFGRDIYYFVGQDLYRWNASQGTATILYNPLSTVFADDAGIEGFGVASPSQMIVNENGNLWVVDISTANGTATYLHNPKTSTNGTIAFDTKRVVFPTSKGPMYQAYDAPTALDLGAAIADGGYYLNHSHSDVQNLSDVDEYVISNDHLIYRGQSGIFAFGFDTRNVVDLLLDRKPGEFDTEPLYRTPSPVGSTLFVQDEGLFNSASHTVYQVDVTGRLR